MSQADSQMLGHAVLTRPVIRQIPPNPPFSKGGECRTSTLSLIPNGWIEILTADTFNQVSTNTKKVKTKDCKTSGKFPVIDQGQSDIAGFVDDASKLIKVTKPLVIFGDHTRIIKWVVSDFVPGADGTKVLEAANFLVPKYFYYQLMSLELPDKGYARHFRYLNETSFKVASLAEQQQIAAKLDELLAQVDNLKTRLDTIPKILKRFRQSVLAAAVSGKLTYDWRSMNKVDHARILQETIKKSRTELLNQDDKESKRLKNKAESHSFQVSSEDKLPDSWIWTSFMDSMERVIDCHNKTAPYVESGIYLIRTPDIRNGIVSLENTRFVNESTYEYWSRRCPPRSGDILFTREAPMGEAGIIPTNTKLCMGQRIMLLRPMPEFTNPKYVLLNILSLPFKERMNKSAVGTAVKHLRVADVESLTYPLAPIEEQTEIVARVEQLFTYADQIEQRVKDAQSRVNHLTQAILAKAFRGELTADWRAQNPDLISGENSAEALLARIKSEREQTQVVKKAKATPSN